MIYIYSICWGPCLFRLNKPGWWQSWTQWGAVKRKEKKSQSACPVRGPQTQLWAMLPHCTAPAWSCTPSTIHIPKWPLTLQSSWQAEPLTAYPLNSFCLYEDWSMKHAVHQNWDAEILNVNRHQMKLSLDYTVHTRFNCRIVLQVFSTVDCRLYI